MSFLHGDLKKEIYMDEGLEEKKKGKSYLLT